VTSPVTASKVRGSPVTWGGPGNAVREHRPGPSNLSESEARAVSVSTPQHNPQPNGANKLVLSPAGFAPSQRFLREGGRLAFAVQTAASEGEVRAAVQQVPPRVRDDMLAALASLVDLDQPTRRHRPTLRRPPRPLPNAGALEAARLAALQPLWDAYRYGDRDPTVVAGHDQYADHLQQDAA
jgi:hypothetical protein